MTSIDMASVEELLESAQRDAAKAEAKKASSPGVDFTNLVDRSGDRHGPRPSRDAHGRTDERPRSRRDDTADRDDGKASSDRSSANGSTRSGRRGSNDSFRPSHRDSYRSSGGDYYRGGGRGRSRSPLADDRHYRPSGSDRRRDDDRRRHRSRSPMHRDSYRRDRRERDQYRGSRGRNNSPRRARTPEPTDEERDRRTVFVQQLAVRTRTKELEAFFARVGPVKEAQVVKDRVSGRSKG